MLQFPPAGAAYRENAASHALWRWLGLNAPDLVILVSELDAGGANQKALYDAVGNNDVAGVAPLISTNLMGRLPIFDRMPADSIEPSPARLEIERRRARTPGDLAALLAPIYGQSWDTPIYIDGMALIAHLGLGDIETVESLAAPYVDGTRDSLQAGPNGVSTLTLAGHLVFAELAERTGDPRYLERARAAADLSFDANGQPLEAVPNHGEMSDAIFMGAGILAAVGDLTGERKYFDMAVRQIDFMNRLVRRDDGLYRHSPLTDAAWGRGNGFSAIGYALTLSKLPEDHPDHARLLAEYSAFMQTLARWQNEDGTWRQVIDHPGAYHETSSTAIIGFSMQRGINLGWLDRSEFEPVVERAFAAVSQRTDEDGGFIDVSESTNKQNSLEAYLDREALAGRDARTGGFALLFAVERGR
jgi:rhamnogalacturonyl hydrolase YesR